MPDAHPSDIDVLSGKSRPLAMALASHHSAYRSGQVGLRARNAVPAGVLKLGCEAIREELL